MMSEFLCSAAPRFVLDINPDAITHPAEQKAVLAMQATVLTVLDNETAHDLNEKLRCAAQQIGAAPTMTYEDIIFVNPLVDGPYVMSEDADLAYDEALFFSAHQAIESHLAKAIEELMDDGSSMAAVEPVQQAMKGLAALHRSLRPEIFAQFRPFFTGLNGYPGPSGLFSAAIPIIDLLVHGGQNITAAEHERMLADLRSGLYPSHQTQLFEQLLTGSREVLASPDVAVCLTGLLNTFRRMHRGSVKKFVRQALEANAEGSGGISDVAGYLASKVIEIDEEGKEND